MKSFLHVVFFAAMVALIMYIFASAAARNTAIDEAKLYQWRLENAVRP